MGMLSSTASITRYRVQGQPENPVMDTIRNGLKENAIVEIDGDSAEKVIGWTSFEDPFKPEFNGDGFIIGPYFVFSLRIDKKSIPSKTIQKHYLLAMQKKLADSDRDHLAKAEKQAIKEAVINDLAVRIPAVPNVYHLLWHMEEEFLWFMTTQKSANEELETLFSASFNLTLMRIFPYTAAIFKAGLTEAQQEALSTLSPTRFAE